MDHAHRPTPPVAAPARARAVTTVVARVTYPYALGGLVGYLALTVVSRDIALMFAGALLVLYGAALSTAVQGRTEPRGIDGAQ